MKQAYIIYNQGKDITENGEGTYCLILPLATHYCSSRGFANHDLTVWREEILKDYGIDEVVSNGEVVSSKKDNEIKEITNYNFETENKKYENENCV